MDGIAKWTCMVRFTRLPPADIYPSDEEQPRWSRSLMQTDNPILVEFKKTDYYFYARNLSFPSPMLRPPCLATDSNDAHFFRW